jgi:pimeloyl-ACP methyl ester carboxylesterase
MSENLQHKDSGKRGEYSGVLGTVVLIHGFFRTRRNIRYMARKLEERGYRVFSPTLPSIFGNVRECSELLEKLIEENVPEAAVVHFVGHSMGGLVIRDYLSRREVKRLGRVVMMGTPNGGSPYANLLLKFPFFRRILKALPDLAAPGLDIPAPLNAPAPEIGIIIGTTDIARKLFLPGDHDGLVTAESVLRVSASDKMLVPCPHERIHWRADTAEAVASFLETGKFTVCATARNRAAGSLPPLWSDSIH